MRWLIKLIGRTLAWRIGRALYMAARGEGVNDMARNGELLVIDRVVEHLAQAGARQATLVDCGANIGEWSNAALAGCAARGIRADLHLMEPSPAAATLLEERFASVENVMVHKIALSDRDGTAQFHLVSPTGGTNSLIADGSEGAATLDVSTARGAAFFATLGRTAIDLVKIDTEGHDFAVLTGFEEMLASGAIGVIQFEYNFRWLASGRSLRDVFALAERHGYRVGRAGCDGIDIYQAWNAENDRFFEWNYLLLTPAMARALRAREMCWGPANTLIPA